MLIERQVGKTSVLKSFGKEQFKHCVYFSLDEEKGVCEIGKNGEQDILGEENSFQKSCSFPLYSVSLHSISSEKC